MRGSLSGDAQALAATDMESLWAMAMPLGKSTKEAGGRAGVHRTSHNTQELTERETREKGCAMPREMASGVTSSHLRDKKREGVNASVSLGG